jgi:hypothetical protein
MALSLGKALVVLANFQPATDHACANTARLAHSRGHYGRLTASLLVGKSAFDCKGTKCPEQIPEPRTQMQLFTLMLEKFARGSGL